MSTIQYLRGSRCEQIVRGCIAARQPVTICLKDSGNWLSFKCAFVDATAPDSALRVTFATDEGVAPPDSSWIGADVGISFRSGHVKCLFRSVVESVFAGNPQSSLVIKRPRLLRKVQRRAFERVCVATGMVVTVRYWPLGGASRREAGEGQVQYGQLEDLSAGGLRLSAGPAAEARVGQLYRCTLTPGSGSACIAVDALLRHKDVTPNGRSELGFQFIGLETTDEQRDALDQIVRLVSRMRRESRPRRDARRRKETTPGTAKK